MPAPFYSIFGDSFAACFILRIFSRRLSVLRLACGRTDRPPGTLPS
jgi:hypothetical protein